MEQLSDCHFERRADLSAQSREICFGFFSILIFISLVLSVAGCNESMQTSGHNRSASSAGLFSEAERIIRQALIDENPEIRTNAIEVVATTQKVELLPEVQRLLMDNFVPVRFSAAWAMGDTKYIPAKSSLELLLKDNDENVRIAAAYALNKLGYRQNFRLLTKAVTSKDQTVRANAVLLLGKSGDKSALKILYWTLKDQGSDDKVRYQAIEAIARLGDERIIPQLWTMLLSAYADVRVMGVYAAGALGTIKTKDILITKLDDDILEVRLAAAEQLAILGDNAGEAKVLEVFRRHMTTKLDENERQRINILSAMAIGRIGTPSAKKLLPKLLNDQSKSVRIAAAKAVLLLENKP